MNCYTRYKFTYCTHKLFSTSRNTNYRGYRSNSNSNSNSNSCNRIKTKTIPSPGTHHDRNCREYLPRTKSKRGVLFESLGNFIHPSLIASSQHLIGRVLFDLYTLELRQVQIIPMAVNRVSVNFGGTPNPTSLPANLTWKYTKDKTWQSGVNSQAKAAYSNIKQ